VDEFASAEKALAVVHHVVQLIGPDDLHCPTPCRDWDVEALAEHLVDTISRLGAAAGIEPTVPQSDSIGHAYSKLRNRSWQGGAAAD